MLRRPACAFGSSGTAGSCAAPSETTGSALTSSRRPRAGARAAWASSASRSASTPRAGADLVRAINEVQKGMVYLSPGISQTVVQAYLTKSDVPPDPLTPREREVLQLVAEGKTTKEVAKLLGISVKTAESHRTRIMEKLEIHETASLVRYAVRRGLIQP